MSILGRLAGLLTGRHERGNPQAGGAAPDLGRALRGLLRSRGAYRILGDDGGTWQAGGCWILGEALRQWAGGSASLHAVIGGRSGGAQHMVVKIGDRYLDADGSHGRVDLLRRWTEDLREGPGVVVHEPSLVPWDAHHQAEFIKGEVPCPHAKVQALLGMLGGRLGVPARWGIVDGGAPVRAAGPGILPDDISPQTDHVARSADAAYKLHAQTRNALRRAGRVCGSGPDEIFFLRDEIEAFTDDAVRLEEDEDAPCELRGARLPRSSRRSAFLRRVGLPLLGEGNTRVVFELDTVRALKVAMNPEGLVDNLVEAARWADSPEDVRRHLAPVRAVAGDGVWLVMDKASRVEWDDIDWSVLEVIERQGVLEDPECSSNWGRLDDGRVVLIDYR